MGVSDGTAERANVLLPDGLHRATLVNLSRPYVRNSKQFGASLRISAQFWPDECKEMNELVSYSVSLPVVSGTTLLDGNGEPMKNLTDEWLEKHIGDISPKSNLYLLLTILGAMDIEEKIVNGQKVPDQRPNFDRLIGQRVQIKTRTWQSGGKQGCNVEQVLPDRNAPPGRRWINPWDNNGASVGGNGNGHNGEAAAAKPANPATGVPGLIDFLKAQSGAIRATMNTDEGSRWLEQVRAMIVASDPAATNLSTMNADAAFRLLSWMQDRAVEAKIEPAPTEGQPWHAAFLAANGIVQPATSEDEL